MSTRTTFAIACATSLACLAVAAAEFPADKTLKDYFWAEELELPQQFPEKHFTFEDGGQGGFTYFSPGIKNVRVDNGILKFRMTEEHVLLGWGNYGGRQPVGKRTTLWDEMIAVRLRVRQSDPDRSSWTMVPWSDGRRGAQPAGNVQGRLERRDKKQRAQGKPVTGEAFLEGTQWTELFMSRYFTVNSRPDGFELAVEGKKGTDVELEWVKIVQPCVAGYVRKEIELPEGKVWRAVVNMSRSCDLYINGEKIDTTTGVRIDRPKWDWTTDPFDITTHVRPGKNCIGMYGKRVGPTSGHRPFFFMQGAVVLETGEKVPFGTDATWQWAYQEQAPEGWCTVGFDDADWQKPERSHGPSMLHKGVYSEVPGYSGLLVLERPDGGKLFLEADADAVVHVRVPAGLQSREPTLAWRLNREERNTSDELRRGSTGDFAVQRESLRFALNLGRLPRGVYSIALCLTQDGETLADRPREPLMVVGPVPQEVVPGDTYTQGLDLELEDEIDCTDPDDPHPWVEAKREGTGGTRDVVSVKTPRIVRKEGLRYRETAVPEPGLKARANAIFYRFEFKHPGSFYLIEVDYPNDKERLNCYGVSSIPPSNVLERLSAPYANEAGVMLVTGLQFPLTDEMRTLRFIHMADSGPHTFDIVSGMFGATAAAGKVRIYRIKGNLPALDVPQEAERLLGIHTERTSLGNGYTRNMGMDTTASRWWWTERSETPVADVIKNLIQYRDSTENYVQYMKFCGQNFHVIAAYQYNENNTPYAPLEQVDDGRLPGDIKSVAAEIFARNGISFVAGIEYSQHKALSQGHLGATTSWEVAQGKDTVWLVGPDGKLNASWRRNLEVLNFNHPAVWDAYTKILDDMVDKFGHLPNFKGVQLLLYPDQLFVPSFYGTIGKPFRYTYDDRTFRKFEKDTGIKVPVDPDDPERFRKRYDFVMSDDIKPAWIEWRCRSIRSFLLRSRDHLRRRDPDLVMMTQLYVDTGHVKEWAYSGETYRDFFRKLGYDPALYRDDEHHYFGRWMMTPELHSEIRFGKKPGYATYWEHHVGDDVLKAYDHTRNRSVVVMGQWDEVGYQGPPEEAEKLDWVLKQIKGRFHPLAGGDNCKEPWAQAMIGTDPDLLLVGYTDANIPVGGEQKLREYARVLLRLPKDKFELQEGTGFGTNFAIRKLSKDGQFYFYVVNPGYWPITGKVRLSGKGRVFNLVSGERVDVSRRREMAVALAPYGIAAYRVDSDDADIADWTTDALATDTVGHTARMAARARELLKSQGVDDVLDTGRQWFLDRSAEAAVTALRAGSYAGAWRMISDWRFWSTLESAGQRLDKMHKYGAALPGRVVTGVDLRMLKALPAGESVKVDGRLEEACWGRAEASRGFVTADNQAALVETSVRGVFGDKALYLAFECADRDPTSLQKRATTERSVFAAKDDALVMFIQPDADMPVYYQMAFNAAGARFDQRVVGGDRDYEFAPEWKAAAAVTDFGWTAEVWIPYQAFDAREPGVGAWRVNFHRVFRQAEVAHSSWCFTGKRWHTPERFGRLVFMADEG